jgi:hypothetical protein
MMFTGLTVATAIPWMAAALLFGTGYRVFRVGTPRLPK